MRGRTITPTRGLRPPRTGVVERGVVRRMLLAVATGAIGMMVLAQVATVLTLAPAGFPDPWEFGGPPAAVAPAGPVPGPAVVPALDPVAAATGLPAPAAVPPPGPAPSPTRAAAAPPGRPAAASPPVSRAAAPRSGASAGSAPAAGAPAASSGSSGSSGSGGSGSSGRSTSGGSGGSGSSHAPLAKVCLKPVVGGCLQVG